MGVFIPVQLQLLLLFQAQALLKTDTYTEQLSLIPAAQLIPPVQLLL
jgi:hypothetical protein